MSNAKPVTAVVNDPKLMEAVQQVKADTEAILAAVKEQQDGQAETKPVPRYFPRGYFP